MGGVVLTMNSAAESITVLHIDDDPDFLDLATDYLEQESDRLSVHPATSPETGLETLKRLDVDCIVSDYAMPNQDGLALLDTVRQNHPNLPFILFTGKGSETVASDAIAKGATDYLQKQPNSNQFQLLANRIVNAVEQYRTQQLNAELDRVRNLMADINQALVRASDRETIETKVCQIISESGPYRFAWFGVPDADEETVTVRASAGIEEDYLDTIEVTTDEAPTAKGPTGTAVRTREMAVIQNIPQNPEYEPWREAALDRGYRSSAAIPILYEDTLYGVLNVYADRTEAFNDRERRLLSDLGDDIAHAIHSLKRKRLLHQERDRRAALFKNAPNPLLEVTFEDDTPRITRVNHAFEETFGLSFEEVHHQSVGDVLVPETELDHHQQLRNSVKDGDQVEATVKRKTASGIRDFLLQIIPVAIGDPSQGAYAWYIDITAQQERAAKITALHSVATELDACDTPTAVYESLVNAAEEVLGYDRAIADAVRGDVLVPKAVSSDIDPAGYYERTPVTASDNLAAQAFREGEPIVVDDLRSREVTPAQSDYRSVISVPIGEYGIFQAVATEPNFFDDTDRELAELLCNHAREALANIEHTQELQHQNERLEEFTKIVSHDLRNPLNVATGRLELATEDCDSDHLSSVRDALDRMESLIENLLQLAKEGEEIGDLEPVALNRIVEQCWHHVETSEATLEIETDRTIHADASRFQQAVENVIRNAVEHGGTDVTITVGDLHNGFYIADDGPGIPRADRERVFEAGFSTSSDGAGFGLATVKQIAQAHGWSITVTESDGGGTRFEFTGVHFVDN